MREYDDGKDCKKHELILDKLDTLSTKNNLNNFFPGL